MKLQPQIMLSGLLLALILGLALWVGKAPAPSMPSAPQPIAPKEGPKAETPADPPKSVELPVGIIGETGNPALPATIQLETGKLPWEEQIDKALEARASDSVKAKSLFGLLPKLPPAAWDRATREALGRTGNRDYNILALPLLINPQANGAVLGILFSDVMDRPESIHLPALLSVARMPGHPFAGPAHENLSAALGHDYASDWSAWDAAIHQHLAADQRPAP